MSNNSNHPKSEQPRAVGTQQFARKIHTGQELANLAPIVTHDMAEIEAAEDTVSAARYAAGEVGADPEFWRRQREIQKVIAAAPDRDLTNAEQKGWDTVNADLRIFDTQPVGYCVTVLEKNLTLARNTQAVYRIAGYSEHQPTLDQEWEARAERLELILDGLHDLTTADAVAA